MFPLRKRGAYKTITAFISNCSKILIKSGRKGGNPYFQVWTRGTGKKKRISEEAVPVFKLVYECYQNSSSRQEIEERLNSEFFIPTDDETADNRQKGENGNDNDSYISLANASIELILQNQQRIIRLAQGCSQRVWNRRKTQFYKSLYSIQASFKKGIIFDQQKSHDFIKKIFTTTKVSDLSEKGFAFCR